tara:strand:- start:14 stop:631 length:618 start_codon:yes stop_codon:yes gene_type:complete
MSSYFITLEGIEGSGKTSSLSVITELLEKKKIKYIVTREPGGSSIGESLRSILLNKDTNISAETELMLMLADRKDHVEKTILPNLEKGVWVISDRFMDSTIAYQGGGRKLGKDFVLSIANNLNIPKPDLTLLFDLPVTTSLKRVKARGKLDRFEEEELDFHQRIRDAYLELAKKESQRIKIIDSTQPIKKMFSSVQSTIQELNNE